MARPLTPQSTNTIAGCLGIVAVLGIAAYFYLIMAKVPDQPAKSKQYNLSVINQDLKAPDAKNVFVKSVKYTSGDQGTTSSSSSSPTTYSSDEIGKTDLTQFGK